MHFTYDKKLFHILQATFEKLESEMSDVNSNSEALKKNFLELTELKHILRKTQTFFDEVRINKNIWDRLTDIVQVDQLMNRKIDIQIFKKKKPFLCGKA